MGMAHPPDTAPEVDSAESAFHTADQVRALNAANPRWWPRYEAAYGELLVTPAPGTPHQWVAAQLQGRLFAYLEREPVGTVYMAPADISWGRRDVTVQPDVFVVPPADDRAARRHEGWVGIRHLLLAVEVTSPSTQRRDRFQKRLLYQRQGVERYWVIDAEHREAEVWTPEADLLQVEREQLVWHPTGAGEAFVFSLDALFARLDAD